jgi:hypothetical protein
MGNSQQIFGIVPPMTTPFPVHWAEGELKKIYGA